MDTHTDAGSTAAGASAAAYPTNDREPPRARDDRSIADLLKDLRDESSTLVRQEIALAKTELSEKASTFGRNAGYVAAGGAVLALGGLLLLHAVAMLVAYLIALVLPDSLDALAPFLGYLIVGGVVAAVGYSLYQKGMTTLKQESAVPEKTVSSLQEDKEWLKNKVTS